MSWQDVVSAGILFWSTEFKEMQQIIRIEMVLRNNDSFDTENKIRKGSSISKYTRIGKIRLGGSKKKKGKLIKPTFILKF